MSEALSSIVLFVMLVALVGAVRVVELAVARRNYLWALRNGGIEYGRGHYPVMVALHAAWFAACLVEVVALDRPFVPTLGWTMVGLVVAAHALRWWCIGSLGRQWSTRVVVLPDLPLVVRGPYRFLRHPNYLAVALEIVALPLVHGAWLTALSFSVLNAVLLAWRIRVEEGALTSVAPGRSGSTSTAMAVDPAPAGRPSFDRGVAATSTPETREA